MEVRQLAGTAIPGGRIVAGLDGGDAREWTGRKSNIDVGMLRLKDALYSGRAVEPVQQDGLAGDRFRIGGDAGPKPRRARRCRRPHARHVAMRRAGLCAICTR
jgi:hypothetical protein